MTLHVCAPSGFHWRTLRHCPTCDLRRWMLVSEYVWYGADLTCLTCGDRWQSGERAPRPFRPRWRIEAVRRARAVPVVTKAEARRSLFAEIDVYVTGIVA